jgi:hypothetical protein
MITVKPWVKFRADFPSDMIEEDGQIVQFGGRNVTLALAQILRTLGCKVSDPIYAGDHGWELDVYCEKIHLWAQISDLYPIYYIMLEDNFRFIGKSNPLCYLDLLKSLNEEFNRDHRFHDITWFDSEDFDVDGVGSDTPVIGEIPEIKVTKSKMSFLDKLLAPFKPLPLKWD